VEDVVESFAFGVERVVAPGINGPRLDVIEECRVQRTPDVRVDAELEKVRALRKVL
jgi:hypothetical protein